MNHRHPLLLTTLAAAVAACSGSGAPSDVEAVATTRAPVIASNRTEVVVYDNPGGEDGLPSAVPVVVSFSATEPSVAVRIACGSNYAHMLEGFGYPRELDLDSVNHYASLDALLESLRARTAQGTDVPLRTLRCGADASATRDQILQVFRTIDADPSKGHADYYVRLREDPGAVYSLGCWNLVAALGWDQGTVPPAPEATEAVDAPPSSSVLRARSCGWGCGWSDAVTVPIDQDVLATWASQGVVRRELNCYAARGIPMPPVDTEARTNTLPEPPIDRARLYRVRYAFDGISAPMPLYLLSDGKGYAIDCGSNQDEIKEALGLPAAMAVPEIAANDPVFLASGPGQQPHLRCGSTGATVFQAEGETPARRYFHFGDPGTVLEFTCNPTADLFARGAAEVRTVPAASVPYLFPNPNEPAARTNVLRVGCAAEDECTARTATCAADTYCVDDYVGYHCEDCDTGVSSDRPAQMADVDGDGRQDLVAFGAKGTVVARAKGGSFEAPKLWLEAFGDGPDAGSWTKENLRMLADVDGDKKADIVGFGDRGVMVSLSTGTTFTPPTLWVNAFGRQAGGWQTAYHPRFLADVDGDGKADVVGFADQGVMVSKSTGKAFSTPKLWVASFGRNSGGWNVANHPRLLADVNGDKKADVVGFANGGVFVGLSTGSAFGASTRWVAAYGYETGNWRTNLHVRAAADVNGDGKADIVGFGDKGVEVSLSNGSSFAAPAMWITNYGRNAGGWKTELHLRYLADVNGDKKADIVGFGGPGVWVSTSTGKSFGPATKWTTEFGSSSGKWSVDKNARFVADVNGDGKADVVGLGSTGVLHTTSTGSSFGPTMATFDDYEHAACKE